MWCPDSKSGDAQRVVYCAAFQLDYNITEFLCLIYRSADAGMHLTIGNELLAAHRPSLA